MTEPSKFKPPPDTTQDPVIFGPDPTPQQRPPDWGEDPSYRPRPRWPFVAAILIMVIVLVGALGLWIL